MILVDVAGWSMAPALSDGDRVLVRRVRFHRIRRGAVVVFEMPSPDLRWRGAACRRSPAGYRFLIKRVTAVPGDPVPDYFALRDRPETVVPPGMLLAVGDNRDDSVDSRAIGYIPAARILGIAILTLHRPRPPRVDHELRVVVDGVSYPPEP
jgi:signal peptidase I